jgi:N-acetylmuramoyl-L-alanine amidase
MVAFYLYTSLWLLSSPGSVELPVVVLDAGHGGMQIGALGVCGLKEKDVTLHITTEVAHLLEASSQVKTHLTRKDDSEVELRERPRIADSLNADLFISIHANASRRPVHRGVETFFLSARGSKSKLSELALRENEGVNTHHSNHSELEFILSGLQHNASHAESQKLAVELQESLVEDLNVKARGVLQERFLVLQHATMAAALVEVGFLTNPRECKLLKRIDYRRKVARSIARAILSHLRHRRSLLAQR